MTRMRWSTAVVVATAAVVVPVAAALPAQAAAEYRWWAYWFVNPGADTWTYSPIGAAGHRVDDGGVEGWRFAVAVPNPSAPSPRTSAASAFQSICGDTERPEGKDRIALVVDFGTTADAPAGEHPPSSPLRGTCVVVPDRSNGLTVLAEAGYTIRKDGSGLVCALQGYPRTECGTVVKPSASPPAKPTPTKEPTQKPTAKPTSSSAPGAPTRSAGTQPSRSGMSPTSPVKGSAAASAEPTGTAVSGSSSPAATQPPSPTGSATGVALVVGPPPEAPGGPPAGFVGLLVGALLVAGVAAAAVIRGRGSRGVA